MSNGDDLTERKYIYDSYFYEAGVISQRTDWFLIFHAILFEADFAASNDIPKLTIGLLGVVLSLLWFFVGYRGKKALDQLGFNYMVRENMGEMGKVHSEIHTERKKNMHWSYRWAKPATIFSIVIPLLIFAAWVIILCTHCEKISKNDSCPNRTARIMGEINKVGVE